MSISKYVRASIALAVFISLISMSGCGPVAEDKNQAQIPKSGSLHKERAILAQYCPAKRVVYMEDKFTILVGKSRIYTDYAEMSNGINLRKWVKSDFDIPLRIRIENGGVLLTTSFHDKKGAISGLIVDNQWVVNTDNIFDRNYYGNTVEVVDKDGIPLLQIYVGDDNNILIGGTLYSDNMRLEPSSSRAFMVLNPARTGPSSQTKEGRIFKYPADAHMGTPE